MKKRLLDLWSVLAGYALFAGLSAAWYLPFRARFVTTPSAGFIAASAAIGMLFAGVSGYAVARFPRPAAMGRVVALMLVMAVVASASLLFADQSGWSPLTVLVVMVPTCWAGGRMAVRRE